LFERIAVGILNCLLSAATMDGSGLGRWKKGRVARGVVSFDKFFIGEKNAL
jgi:hypothetical protein